MNKNKSVLDKYKNKKTLHTSLFEVKEIVEDVKNHNISSRSSPNNLKHFQSNGQSSPQLNKYRSYNDPDLEDDTDIQTILTADDNVKQVLNQSKNNSKSLVREIKEFV